MQRFKTSKTPCPICTGYDRKGRNARCWGFLTDDGTYAHCTSDAHAGPLTAGKDDTYTHWLKGPCKCGQTHGAYIAPPVIESAAKSRPDWQPIAPAPDDAPPCEAVHYQFGRPTAIKTARDAEGRILCHEARYTVTGKDGQPAKETRPWSWCEDRNPDTSRPPEWRCKGLDGLKPLYGLDRLAAATGNPMLRVPGVLLVEGPKAADAAAAMFPGYPVLSMFNGKGAADRSDLTPLVGHEVIGWPDNDEAGADWVAGLAKALRKAGAASFSVVALPDGLPAKWDLADPFPAGFGLRKVQPPHHSADDLPEMIEAIAGPDARSLAIDLWPILAGLGDTERAPHVEAIGRQLGITGDECAQAIEAAAAAELARCISTARTLIETAPPAPGWSGEGGDLAEAGEGERTKKPKADRSEKARRFEVNEDTGVWLIVTDAEGNEKPTWVCSPLWVEAVTRDQSGANYGRRLRFLDTDGNPQTWVMPQELLSGDGAEIRGYLLNHGMRFPGSGRGRTALLDYLQETPAERMRCADRLGWHGDTFVLPDACCTAPGDEQVIYQAGLTTAPPIRTAGTLIEWSATIGRWAVGNDLLALAVSLAFVPPLLDWLNEDGRGFHFRGATSSGKTTLLRAAGSVWGGGGRNGYRQEWRQTDNHMETIAKAHSDCLLLFDELGQADPKSVGNTVYMLANGRGKGRATKHGGSRETATFRTLYLSAGEESLSDVMKRGGRQIKGGQDIRLVDLPADAGAGLGAWQRLHGAPSAAEFSEWIKEASDTHYGHPIRAFLQFLNDHREDWPALIAGLKAQRAAFLDKALPGATGEARRALGGFALAAAAGELATEAGILPWPDGEAERAALACAAAWLNERGTPGAVDMLNAVRRVTLWLQQNQSSRFQTWTKGRDGEDSPEHAPDRPIVDEAGFREWVPVRAGYDHEGRWHFLVYASVFREVLCEGFNYRAVTKELADKGLLIRGWGGRLMSRETLPGRGEQSFYRIVLPAGETEPGEDAAAAPVIEPATMAGAA